MMKREKNFRNYSDLIKLKTFNERFEYLKLEGCIGESTFGFDRYLNQAFYRSREWRKARDAVLLRDGGWDLGIEGYYGGDRPIIHHMNPITEEDIENRNKDIFNPEYLICVSPITHNALHYCGEPRQLDIIVERKPFDTCPWKGGRND